MNISILEFTHIFESFISHKKLSKAIFFEPVHTSIINISIFVFN